jgi:serine/threonine-protein kinase
VKLCPTCGTGYPDDQKFCPRDGTALRSTAHGSLIDSVIADRYHIVKKLGEGGMGAVYLGEHVKMGRKSAIKVMSSSMAGDPEAIARFNREAANAARINHPNVCAIYDFGDTPDGLIYLAMEFIEGESLGDVLDREGTLPPARAVSILRQTADALQAAHDLGIVHRDLKPDNIMLSRGRGGADVVKVVDFGIAKAMSGEQGQQVTRTGLVVGTPEYMSPEQLSGDVLDGRSDGYSLALVFYRMLTGTFPFPSESAQEMMIKRLTDDPRPLDSARPGVRHPPALQQVMDRALARMPRDRYASTVQFAHDAESAVAGWTGGAVPVAAGEAATQIIDATSSDGTIQLAPTQVRGTPGTVARQPAGPATPTTPRPITSPPMPRKKRSPALAIAAAVVVLGGGATAAWMLGAGGNGAGAGPDSLRSAVDTPVTTDTAGRVAGRQDSTGRTGGTAPIRRVTPDTSGVAPPPVDVDRIAGELRQLGRDIENAESRAAAIRRATELSDQTGLPQFLRARAAQVAAEGYNEAGNTDDACRMNARAIDLDPGNAVYVQARTGLFGCPR